MLLSNSVSASRLRSMEQLPLFQPGPVEYRDLDIDSAIFLQAGFTIQWYSSEFPQDSGRSIISMFKSNIEKHNIKKN